MVGTLTGIMALAAVVPALASSPQSTNLLSNGNNWRVYNIAPATNYLWDINKAESDGAGGVQFPFQQFVATDAGSFAVYLQDNYNVDLMDKTITADVNWTPATGPETYVTRGPATDGAYVRLEFQDVASGNYTSNDYWWYSGSGGVANLNTESSANLVASLADRANWTNVCGQSAADITAHPGPNCVGGTDPAVSPYDGFTNAMKNVKEVNLSFGRASRYASGVAASGTDQAIFDMTSFTVN